MTHTIRIDGQCHCGAVSYEAEIDPERVSVCHCTDCQVLTGSPYRATVHTVRAQLKLSGAPKCYVKIADSGRKRYQYFCGDCGTPVYVTGEPDDQEIGLRWGAIRQRASLVPKRQIWCASAVSWAGPVLSVPQHARDPHA